MHSHLQAIVSELQLALSSRQIDQLVVFAERLATSAHNLISARDREHVESRHIGEALTLGRLLDDQGLLTDGTRVLDLGAGGGLPGIPIRLAWPWINLVLLESVGKKCRFLEEIVSELELAGVDALEGRAETWGHNPAHRERYDLVLARAVAPLPVLIEYALPFLHAGGQLAAVKGANLSEEMESSQAALGELQGRLIGAFPFAAPGDHQQSVVLIEKTAPTPPRYPRRAGLPSKRPL